MALGAGMTLALALILANWVYADLAEREVVLRGSPGELLYAAAFTGFHDEWQLYAGQQSAAIVDERLELRVNAAGTAAWSLARPAFAEFDLRVSAKALEGPVDNAFGLVFGARGAAGLACDLPAVIFCGIEELLPLAGAALRQAGDSSPSQSYFAFLISSDGYYSLWKITDAESEALSAWIASPRIRQGLGAENALRATARAGRYQFFVNGEQLALCLPEDPGAASTYAAGECVGGSMRDSYIDDSMSSGRIGFIAQATASGGGGVAAAFDNLIVFSPLPDSDEDIRA